MDSADNKQFSLLEERIPYDKDTYGNRTVYEKALGRLLEDSKYIALSERFPFDDFSDMELPKRYNNWQLRCCEELLMMVGKANIKSYAENGVSWTRDGGNLSPDLYGEIMPSVGVIKDE